MAEEGMKDDGLFARLFATDHYPIRRLNIYSKLDLVDDGEAGTVVVEDRMDEIATSKVGDAEAVPLVIEDKMDQTIVANVAMLVQEDKMKDVAGTSKTTEISRGNDDTAKTSETEEVDDVNSVKSPPKKKRKRGLVLYDEEIGKMLKTNREKRPREATKLFPALEKNMFDLMLKNWEGSRKRVHKPTDAPYFSNKTLLDIAALQRWIESSHMDVLMYMLNMLHSRVLTVQRSMFVSPYFINLVYSKVEEFKRSKEKRRVKWSQNLKKFVKNEKGEWLADFDTMYIPMSIENKHWIGLAINLQMSSIEVLDPNCDFFTERKIGSHIQHLSMALPHILKSFCSFQFVVNVKDTPFLVERTRGLYKKERGGD